MKGRKIPILKGLGLDSGAALLSLCCCGVATGCVRVTADTAWALALESRSESRFREEHQKAKAP